MQSKNIYKLLTIVIFAFFAYALEIPLSFNGRVFLGKYLNSDTSRYNMDASVKLYCQVLKYKSLSLFINYQDDLDMARQTGGVSLDPRYAHYYITAGLHYFDKIIYIAGYLIHDCIHDIDFDVEGTPVFNRFRLRIASPDNYFIKRLKSNKRFIWSLDLGAYPHWKYHSWDINAGADYHYDLLLRPRFILFKNRLFGIELAPQFHFTRGDTCFYHQHLMRLQLYYKSMTHRIGTELAYHLYNNDPIKNPDKLWISSIFIEF